jgi:hypothetical protein
MENVPITEAELPRKELTDYQKLSTSDINHSVIIIILVRHFDRQRKYRIIMA